MKLHQQLKGLSIGAAVLAHVAQPVWAATELRAVRLRPTGTGIELIFTTQGDSRPPILTTNRDNSIVADLAETRLRLPETPDDPFGERNSFRKDNPAPGIASVTVSQLNARSVRVTVRGINNEPIEQVVRQSGTSLILSFNRTATTRPASRVNASERAARDDDPEETSDGATPSGDNQALPAPAQPPRTSQPPPAALPPSQPPRTSQPSSVPPAPSQPPRTDPPGPVPPVPPQPPRTGRPTAPQAPEAEQPSGFGPPLLPRAAAPPVGDIAVATIDITPRADEEEGRVILRTYRLNQLRATSSTTIVQRLTSRAETGGTVGGRATSGFVDDSGSSSFESGGTTTAQTALGRTTSTSETVRYQGAKEILQAFGANGAETSTNTDESFDDGTSTDEDFADDETNTDESFDDGTSTDEDFADDETNTDESFDDSASDSAGRSASLLRGLEVVAEARTNTVTLIGSPRLVEIGTAILTQFDVRRRQVAVNVKIVDVDLTKGRNSNADLRFRVNNSLGVGFTPDPADPQSVRSGFLGIIGDIGSNADFGITSLARGFLANLFASIEDQSAKILTNPTLVVQEGSSAQVNLTQEIFSGVEITEVFDDANGRARTRPIIRPAGVIVNVTVDHIDDNGFIDLSISPEVSAPSGTFQTDEVTGTLIAQRRLETGLVRLRDGQTLILTGIIQDQDRVRVSKVPILGDIPLLGRLFRREEKVSERREVVVAVTPQILNDTDPPSFPRYQYRPGPDAQKLLKP